MDTIGVRAGCSVILFSDSNYNGNSVKIDATRQNNDRCRYIIIIKPCSSKIDLQVGCFC